MYKTLFSVYEFQLSQYEVNNRYLLQGLLSLDLRGFYNCKKIILLKLSNRFNLEIKFMNILKIQLHLLQQKNY